MSSESSFSLYRWETSNAMALVFALSHVLSMVSSTSPLEELPSGSALHVTYGDGMRAYGDDVAESFISANINITHREDNEWKWKREESGRYGTGYVGPAFGVVIHVSGDLHPDDHTGCTLPLRSTRSDRTLPPPGEPWIALIRRGRCNFEDKIANAFKSNAAGVLVYNDRDSPTLDKMKLSSESGRNISAVFTYKSTGEQLAKLVENDSRVLVHITIASRMTSRAATINRTSVLFVSITFIVLMIIALAWLVFYYVQRFRYIHAKDRLSRRLCSAAKKALSKIPTKNIKSDDKEVQEGECCAICIEPYKISDVLRMLPCRHEFHKSCIDPWLLEHRTCPMCKMDILKHYGFMFTGSQESILHMEIEEVVGLGSSDSQDSDSPRRGGVSPLPQIRTVVLADRRRSYDSSTDVDEHSSRASTPNETTPSLSASRRSPVRPDLCANCIAAASLVSNETDRNVADNPLTTTPTTTSPPKHYVPVSKTDSKDGLKEVLDV